MPETQRCAACKRPLSRYNPDPLCSSCLRAARYGPDGAETPADGGGLTPVWLWDSPPMRRALAGLDLAAMMVIFRAATGLSQLELAQLLGWSQSTVSLIEKGQRDTLYDIRELRRFADAVIMPREALLPVIVGQPDAVPANDDIPEGIVVDVNRRTFGSLAAGAAVAALVPESTVPSQATISHVRYLQASLDSLYVRDRTVGGGALLGEALRHWQRARRMLDESVYTDSLGHDLVVLTGRLADFSGWLAFDAGNVSLARQMYSHGLLLTGNAGEPLLSARLLAHQSGLSSYIASKSMSADLAGVRRGLAREAVRFAQQAADVARHEPMPGLHVVIALRHAYAASLLGNQQEFRSAITRARHELDRGPRADDPEWVRNIGESAIIEEEARGYVNLGDPARGADLYRRALEDELSPRARAYKGAMLAGALFQQGAWEDAITEGAAVLPTLASGVTSIRTLNELRPLRAVDGPHTEERAAFCEQFDAVARSMAS
jgi:transcriptional regulator with XRE-family HTH domain